MELYGKVNAEPARMVPVEKWTGKALMLGVVVWSNEARSKAVIWCEDQGALAYLEGADHIAGTDAAWPSAGDLVELDSGLEGGLRVARNVRLLSRGVGAALPRALRARAARAEAPARTAPISDPAHLRLVSDRALPEDLAPATQLRSVAHN